MKPNVAKAALAVAGVNSMDNDNRFRNDYVRSAVNLMKAGAICAGVSLIIIGVPLSIVGLILVLVGRARMKKAESIPGVVPWDVQSGNKIVRISLGVALAALILNAISLYLMWPLIMHIVETGDISVLYPATGALAGGSGGSSTWG